MTNMQQIATWHAEKPSWTATMTARDWSVAELIAEQLDRELAPDPEDCLVATEHTAGAFYCTRQKGHDGPCAAVPADEAQS